ncbi:hypothetical protein PDJAM_G00028540 [Pangasius djambal]|uniref:Uncharacterized protein n=1 Tax=Pangasius djambal TaxID=1691987 RepID=A0ACC5YQH2_9TELE|nr:hypothetical protein [Pangasius djambal]
MNILLSRSGVRCRHWFPEPSLSPLRASNTRLLRASHARQVTSEFLQVLREVQHWRNQRLKHLSRWPLLQITVMGKRNDSFTPAFVSTVGIDFKVKTIYRNDKRIKLQIWDTAGQERYRTITTAYYRGAMGFILMYDITNEESFAAVQDWSTQIKTYSWDNAQVLLVGNKCDMDDERVVASERGRQLSEHLGFEFFEASAKDNINVKQTFERLVDIICEKMSESLDAGDPAVTGAKQGPQLTEQPAAPHQDCAC